MNELVKRELKRLSKKDIGSMCYDYHQTFYYSLRDIAHKYVISFATACHIVKSSKYCKPITASMPFKIKKKHSLPAKDKKNI